LRFEAAAAVLDGIPYTSTRKGRILYQFVIDHGLRAVLELGFAHGVSSGYLAAALDETQGRLTTVDRIGANFDPTAEELLDRLGLAHLVDVRREASSYTWFLHDEIAAQSRSGPCTPKYDLVFIDGPKDWTNDGAAFFMAAKLLRPGGWVMFDDYSWSYASDAAQRGVAHSGGYVFDRLSPAELHTPQIREIFHLLVMQDARFSGFEVIDDQLAIARKVTDETARSVLFSARLTPAYRLRKAVKRLFGR